MARSRSSINQVTDLLYGAAKALRWVKAAQGGPDALAKRAGRVAFGRAATRLRRKVIKP